MTTDDSIKNALENKNCLQAVASGRNQGVSPDDIRSWQCQALWELAAVYRNDIAVKILAADYGFSKEELHALLEKQAEETAEGKALKPRYDYVTNRHLDFHQWLDQLFRRWNTLTESPGK